MIIALERALDIARSGSIPEPNTGCWLWLGSAIGTPPFQYAATMVGGKQREVCRLLLGLTERRFYALHRCDTPLCVNPEHLFRGRASINMCDKVLKGRERNQNSGKTHCKHGHELTAENTYSFPQSRVSLTGRRTGRACVKCRREAVRRYQSRAASHQK